MTFTDFSAPYSDFLRLNGHRVIETQSSLWIDVRPMIFQRARPFNLSHIEKDEVSQVFKSGNVLVCRWFEIDGEAPAEGRVDERSMVYVAYPPFDLQKLEQKARNQTRRGLERVSVRKMDLDDRTERLAYEVYSDNVKRLGILDSQKQIADRWKVWVNTIRNASCVEFWSAWNDGALAAFTIAVRSGSATELVLQRSAYSALNLYPNNALVYTITKNAFERGSQLVSFGLSGFSDETNGLHRFKVNMGFSALPLKVQYEWHPWIRPLSPLLNTQYFQSAYRNLARMLPR